MTGLNKNLAASEMGNILRFCLLICLFIFIGLTGACQYIPPNSTHINPGTNITVVNYPKPDLEIVITGAFINIDCPENEYGYQGCLENSPLANLGCHSISEPSNLLGALEPKYPLMICQIEPVGKEITQMFDDKDYFANVGCRNPIFTRYVIFKDDEYKLIKNEREFRELYAPITSANEALSYALAITGFSAYYDLEKNPEYRYFENYIEDTHVVELDNGFEINLYDYKACGCGPHPTSMVRVQVLPDGKLSQTPFTKVYEDPKEDSLCID